MKTRPAFCAIMVSLGLILLLSACAPSFNLRPARWTEEELSTLRSLWIGNLPPLPPNPSNRYADDLDAARLGQKFFFDTRLSVNGQVACATCHLPEKAFQDGIPLAKGVGTTNRRTMTVIGTAYSPWLFWDGRKDSLWAQALGPLENPVEHGGDRTLYAHVVQQHYAGEFEAVFGPLPDLTALPPSAGPVTGSAAQAAWDAMSPADQEAVTQIYVNVGKAIEAYERRLQPGASRFDRYVEAVLENDETTAGQILTPDEIAGLRLFIGQANCINCHNGPLFTNNGFHNTGVPVADGLPEDTGRLAGVKQVREDEFNCLSRYSDAASEDCVELNFLVEDDEHLLRQYKPPSLRNVADRGPFMHAGQFATLDEVLNHYNLARPAPAGESELEALNLSEAQLAQLRAFLLTLDSPVEADPEWLKAPNLVGAAR